MDPPALHRQADLREGLLPGEDMGIHGIDERSIKVEDQGAHGQMIAARLQPPSRDQRGGIVRRPKNAPCGSRTIAKRPPGNSWGAIISCPPTPIAVLCARSMSSTLKYTDQ